MEGANSHYDVSPPFDLLAITNTTWQRVGPPELLPAAQIMAPTLNNLRNFFLSPTAELPSFFQL